jgi:hypothetical protein
MNALGGPLNGAYAREFFDIITKSLSQRDGLFEKPMATWASR